jgi:tetratricopeptide (TPR) repeat protein
MELTLDEALQKAVEAHKAGQTQEADRLYKAILQAQPKHSDANHNMGVLAFGVGSVQESLPFFKTALEANPSIGQYWLSYIDALIKLDRMGDARSVLGQAKSKGAKGESFDQLEQRLNVPNEVSIDPPQAQLQTLINLYKQGQLQQTLNSAKQLLSQFPNSLVLCDIQGATNAALGQFDAAIDSYKQALKIKPDYADAYNNIGNALQNKGELEVAIESYKQALKIKPNSAESYNNMGNALQGKGDFEASIDSFKKALKIQPDYAEAYNNMGNALKAKGDLEVALDSYKKALKIKPDYAEAYNNMGVVLKDKGDFEASIDSFTKALKIKPDYAEAYYNMGNALYDQGDLAAAIDGFKQAIKITPGYAEAYNSMGHALSNKGDPEAAIDSYNKALKIKPNFTEVHRHLSSITKYDERTPHVVYMQNLHQNRNITEGQRCHLSFALAKAFEDLNEFDQSFSYLELGNKIRKKILAYDINQDMELFSLLKKSYPDITKIALKLASETSILTPIFILGMPRSGTTLVEQILSSHTDITGAGELTYVEYFGKSIATGVIKPNTEIISNFRQSYIEALKKRSDGRSIVTDKMPQNFRYIGLIFSAFPNAKVIHVNRDPAATCWSNYKHYFVTQGLGYGYNLDDMVAYFGLYEDLMQFWQERYRDRIYNLNYENLTINQEDETRKLIDYLGLEWESNCLFPQSNERTVHTASNQQVRQKVYQGSSQEWRKFEPFIGGAFDSLMEFN